MKLIHQNTEQSHCRFFQWFINEGVIHQDYLHFIYHAVTANKYIKLYNI